MESNMKLFSAEALSLKLVVIFALLLVMLIPLQFIKRVIAERADYRKMAEDSIILPTGGQLFLEGIAIAVPYAKEEKTEDNGSTSKQYYIIEIPEKYALSAKIDPYFLSRGIFTVPVFSGTFTLSATFPAFRTEHLNILQKDILYQDALLILGLRNKKSLTAYPSLKVNGAELEEAQVITQTASLFSEAVYYSLPKAALTEGFSIDGSVAIQGGKSVSLVPMAGNSSFAIESSWASPKFSGSWLPTERAVGKNGFNAEWHISGLSTSFLSMWKTENADIRAYGSEAITVDFIEPLNNYAKAKRCIAYALLFLACPFLAIFLCELWSAARIHPVQYFLIALEDALFYLLLLSISEHVSFNWSYLLSALIVSLIVLFYAAAIFKKLKWALMLFAVQGIAYLLLFGILQSEDYALLIGTIGIFSVLALIMFLTRNVDWYKKMPHSALDKQDESKKKRPSTELPANEADNSYQDMRRYAKTRESHPDADTDE